MSQNDLKPFWVGSLKASVSLVLALLFVTALSVDSLLPLIIIVYLAAVMPYVLSLSPPKITPPPAEQLLRAVEALRRAGVDEQWIREFVTFEPEPTPKPEVRPVGDNAALLVELKAAWEGHQPRRATQIRSDNHVTLRDMDGNIVGRYDQ